MKYAVQGSDTTVLNSITKAGHKINFLISLQLIGAYICALRI